MFPAPVDGWLPSRFSLNPGARWADTAGVADLYGALHGTPSPFETELIASLERLARHGATTTWLLGSEQTDSMLVIAATGGDQRLHTGTHLSCELGADPLLAGRRLILSPVALPDGRRAGLLIGVGDDDGIDHGHDEALSALLADSIGSLWGERLRSAAGERRDDVALCGPPDPLTGLMSRPAWDRMMQLEERRRIEVGQAAGVICITVNDVRHLNDTSGHEAGDAALREAADHLARVLENRMFGGRLRGDMLAVYVPLEHGEQLLTTEARFRQVFEDAAISVSMGAAVTIGMIRLADVAAAAEDDADAARKAFDEIGSPAFLRKSELGSALDSGAIRAYFQPIVDLRSGQVMAIEALARWQTPTAVLEPGEFLDELSSHGMMHLLFEHILDDGLRWTAEYRRRWPQLQLAVNVEFGSLPADGLAAMTASSLAAHDLPPNALSLELAGREPFDIDSHMFDDLHQVAASGVELILDDFGTGFASLEVLTRLPMHGVKLDRRFTSQVGRGEREHAVVKATIAMAVELGLVVVAEGVETQQQSDQLVRLGCRLGQGYLFSLPQPPEMLSEVLAAPLVSTF